MPLDRIVLGLDFTASSIAAAQWTRRDLAPSAELVLVHVIATGSEPALDASTISAAHTRAETRLCEIRDLLGPGRLRTEVRMGDPALRIAEVAAELHADLVVVGPHEAAADRPETLGSTAERLVACSPVPVLLVAGEMRRAPMRLLVPVDGGDLSAAALDWARMLETRFDSSVAIVHVAHAGDRADGKERDPGSLPATPRWRQLTAMREPTKVFVDAVEGNSAAVIMAQAARFGSDLVVTDVSAGDLLRAARCPVLVTCGPSSLTSRSPRGRAPACATHETWR